MFGTIDEIQSQLHAGEDSCAAFMEVRVDGFGNLALSSEAIAETMVAFANVEGGCIFMGVDDEGVVQGIPEDRVDALESLAQTVASDSCDPPVEQTLCRVRLPSRSRDDAIVVLVRIRKGLYCHRTISGRHYRRLGRVNHILDTGDLGRLSDLRRGRRDFDVQAVPGAALEDLDSKRVESYLGTYRETPSATVLQKARIAVEMGGALRPTVAGLLAFGRSPSDRLHSASISVAAHSGFEGTPGSLVDGDQIDGPVGCQIDTAVAFVDRHMWKLGTTTVNSPSTLQYDLDAVFEAVVNAVVHRDYSISESSVRIRLYADRLEIYSPGGLLGTLLPEHIEFRVSTRNQLLAQYLSRTRSRRMNRPYVGMRGGGVRMTLQAGDRISGRRPVYEMVGEELRLTIWAQQASR